VESTLAVPRHSEGVHAAFDVFISYSRRDDIEFARHLERTIESYRPPKELPVQQRYLKAFRDESDFTGVEYFQAVDDHLREASKLVVICSPAARASKYVNDEIKRFASYRGPSHIIPVLINGIPNNEAVNGRELEKAFPEALVETLQMPRAIDYRGLDPRTSKLDSDTFAGSWYSLLAEIYGLSREVVEQRERRRRARRQRVTLGVIASVVAILSAALIWALISRQEAIRQRNIALARQLAAQGDLILQREPYLLERAALLGAESLHRLQTPEGDRVVRTALELLPQPVMDVTFPHHVVTAVLAPGAEYVAVAGESGVDLFNYRSKERLTHIPDEGMVFTAAISPDGKWLVTGDSGGKIGVFGIPSGRPHTELNVEGQVTNVVFAPDGTRFAARSMSPTVKIWAVESGTEVEELSHGNIVQSIAFTRDGRRLCAGTKGGRVYLWDLSSRKVLRQIETGSRVASIACGISGQVIIATGKREVQVWADTPAQSFVLQAQHPVTTVLLRGDEQYLALAGENRATILDARSWTPVARLAHEDEIEAVVFHPRQPIVATGSNDRTARIWDIRSGEEVARISHQGSVLDVNFDGNGQHVVTASEDDSARVVELKAAPGMPWETGKVTALDFGSTRYVATGDLEGTIRIWDRQTSEQVRFVPAFNKDEITAICLSPDERHFAGATRSGAITVWDLVTGSPSFEANQGAKVSAIVAEDDGTTFAGGEDGKVNVWSSSGKLQNTLTVADPVTGLALSPAGKSLAVTMGRFGLNPHGGTVLFNLGTGQVIQQLEESRSPIQAAGFSIDSKWLLTAGQDNVARLWNLRTGKQVAKLVHEHPVMAAVLTPDGRYALTGSVDSVARIWETTTGYELVQLKQTGTPRSVRFIANRRDVLVASFDPSGILLKAREYQWAPDELIQQVCSRMATRLTPTDWTRYISVEPYNPVCPPQAH
jgi:WD40 repeat protein